MITGYLTVCEPEVDYGHVSILHVKDNMKGDISEGQVSCADLWRQLEC